MAARLMPVMVELKAIFVKYAGADGNAESMTKAELSKMLKAEFGMGASAQKDEVDKFFSALDADGSGSVNYVEYATFVAVLSSMM